jgi:hypothetical protein
MWYHCDMNRSRDADISDSGSSDTFNSPDIYSVQVESDLPSARSPQTEEEVSFTANPFQELKTIRETYRKNIIIGYINVNSLRNKHFELSSVLYDGMCDILFIAETKLDDTFLQSCFDVPGFRAYRKDRDAKGGGLLAYVRSDLPARRREDLEFPNSKTETIVIECGIQNRRWAFVGIYKPPSVSDDIFTDSATLGLDKLCTKYDNIMVTGDLNFDMSHPEKGKPLVDFCDVFDLTNKITNATCFVKNCQPSLVDVVLTNKPTFCFNPFNFTCGVSDWHNFIGIVIKVSTPRLPQGKVKFRSYTNFDSTTFVADISSAPFNVAYVFDDIDDIYWAHEHILNNIIDEHLPVKEKKPRVNKPPFFNSTLRRAVYQKKMLFNKFKQSKSNSTWEAYRKQRNQVVQIKKQSVRNYFLERCGGGPKSKDFWPTIKPFLSNKCKNEQKTVLEEENQVISDTKEVCDIFNNFFSNVANDIGKNLEGVSDFQNHPSIKHITSSMATVPDTGGFAFENVDFATVSKLIDKLDCKKSTGVDGISAKMLKAGSKSLCFPLTNLINFCMAESHFPANLKQAQVIPILKKNDPMNKENYRPVSILPTVSKLFERIIHNQLSGYFEQHFNPYLAAFRQGYGCQSVLLRLLEDWRQALDNKKYVGAILMDLSKAFDCIPHNLLICKLKAYGIDDNAANLVCSYLSDRKQRMKIGPETSDWCPVSKGVPQGSIVGPLIFNIFINDIFMSLQHCDLYNYADDNTLSNINTSAAKLKQCLEEDSRILIDWFNENGMKANPSKFQAICIGKKTFDSIENFHITDQVIECQTSAKLLGVELDYLLNFDLHISNICRKASRQLAILKRIGSNLSKQGKIVIFKSFISSNFNFCPLAWHFCGVRNTRNMEKIQEMALRFIENDYTSPIHILHTTYSSCLQP